MFAKKNQIQIFDNGGKTADRFTVLIGKDVFGMGDNFNQFSFTIGDRMGEHQLNPNILKEKKLKFTDVPKNIQNMIKERVES